MNALDEKIIRLKYEGNTYKEISLAIGRRFSENYIAHLFELDGRLYIPYLEYEAIHSQFIEDEVRKDFKRAAQYSYKIKKTILQKALKAGDLGLANQIASEILDRAGVVIVRKAEVNVDDKTQRPIETYEQFSKELERLGIDPRTGLRVAKA